VCWFKLGPVTPTGLAQLSHTPCYGMTGGHAGHGDWVTSHATIDDVTHQSRQMTRRDSRLCGATSPAGHAPVHMARLLHKSHQPNWHDLKGSDLEKAFRPGLFLKI
jgi:hypothetical protein